jgi:hypothetical protein
MSKYASAALRSCLTFANVVALLALFVALGGSSYAAITLSNNSVKSQHIAKGAVKRADIARGAVNSAKVANGSLSRVDFKAGELPKGDPGPTGPQGSQGPQGPQGPAGSVRAWGHVFSSGSIAGSAGVKSVTQPSSGLYCIVLDDSIDPATTTMIATPDAKSGVDTGFESFRPVQATSDTDSCIAGGVAATDFEVRTYYYNGDELDDDDGGGNSTGDTLSAVSHEFSFIVP